MTIIHSGEQVASHIRGQQCATQFIDDLSALCPVGDDLFFLINQHTNTPTVEAEAWLRGFLRAIQKRLESI